MRERDRASLIGIGFAEKLWDCCCYCGGVRFKGLFLEVGEGGKISASFFDNTPSVRTSRRWLLVEVLF